MPFQYGRLLYSWTTAEAEDETAPVIELEGANFKMYKVVYALRREKLMSIVNSFNSYVGHLWCKIIIRILSQLEAFISNASLTILQTMYTINLLKNISKVLSSFMSLPFVFIFNQNTDRWMLGNECFFVFFWSYV